jgi:hypothetical protein
MAIVWIHMMSERPIADTDAFCFGWERSRRWLGMLNMESLSDLNSICSSRRNAPFAAPRRGNGVERRTSQGFDFQKFRAAPKRLAIA